MGTKSRYFLSALILLSSLFAFGMEYGLRFKSHSFPTPERTSLSLGDRPYQFKDQISLGFDMGFYDTSRFGLICTITGDDGTAISLVSSSGRDRDYQPGIVINDKLNLVPVRFDATPAHPSHSVIELNRKDNTVQFTYNQERFTFPVDLSRMKSATIHFGKAETQASVAPVEIQDIRIFIDKKNTHRWELRRHDGDSVTDDLSDVVAVAQSPHWILDDHVSWREIYSMTTDEKVQTAFDPRDELFYIVTSERITEFNPLTHASTNIRVDADARVMKYSNYLFYDTIAGQLLSYSLEPKQTNRFDFKTHRWLKGVDPAADNEPRFANHGFASDGHNAYMFGGYGFYMYNNMLVRLDLATGSMEDITLHPLPDPRTSASLCVAGGKLYIFGGMGNSVGKQEIPSRHYFDLWEYDLETMKGKCLWETDTVSYQFLPSQSMYYVPRDSCFYVASTLFGGCMMRISPSHPGYEVVSQPIRSIMDYRDCVFNLYRSADGRNYYLVIDKRLNDYSHEYRLYHIAYPFSGGVVAKTPPPALPETRRSSSVWWWLFAVLLLVSACAAWWFERRRRLSSHTASDTPAPSDATSADDSTEPSEPDAPFATASPEPAPEPPAPARFDRSRSAISFLGTFEIKDRNGADITPKFTSRTKDLLIMLILFSEKGEKGVGYQTLDEAIWGDKDEKSAKNNRNVYMRKLRLLLSEVGNADITYEKGYYRIDPADVTIDYHEVMTRIGDGAKGDSLSGERLEEAIELLLYGPLLPDTVYDWLDDFKSNYTATSLHILSGLLGRIGTKGDREILYKIAETISLHDPLSEEALAVKCRILTQKRMKGVAKSAYDAFCREYERSYGEEYPVPFSQLIKRGAKDTAE